MTATDEETKMHAMTCRCPACRGSTSDEFELLTFDPAADEAFDGEGTEDEWDGPSEIDSADEFEAAAGTGDEYEDENEDEDESEDEGESAFELEAEPGFEFESGGTRSHGRWQRRGAVIVLFGV